jgi:hypothetical protein
MARMSMERKVLMYIRHRINAYNRQREADQEDEDTSFSAAAESESDEETPLVEEPAANPPRIKLGSRQRKMLVSTYHKQLKDEIGCDSFVPILTQFLQERGVDVQGDDFQGDGFVGHQLNIKNCSVS